MKGCVPLKLCLCWEVAGRFLLVCGTGNLLWSLRYKRYAFCRNVAVKTIFHIQIKQSFINFHEIIDFSYGLQQKCQHESLFKYESQLEAHCEVRNCTHLALEIIKRQIRCYRYVVADFYLYKAVWNSGLDKILRWWWRDIWILITVTVLMGSIVLESTWKDYVKSWNSLKVDSNMTENQITCVLNIRMCILLPLSNV